MTQVASKRRFFITTFILSVIVGYLNTLSPNEYSSMTIQVKHFRFREPFSRPYFPFKNFFIQPRGMPSSVAISIIAIDFDLGTI